MLVWILVAAGAFLLYLYLSFKNTHNRLMALDERCNTSFADIDVLLKHRQTLIPGILETVRAVMSHETNMFGMVMETQRMIAEATSTSARLDAEAAMGNVLNTVVTSADRYPEMQSNRHFVDFRNSLTETENRITAARRHYNSTVDEYNATYRGFPGILIARLSQLLLREHFTVGEKREAYEEQVAISFAT